jgi:hypothetical protein
LENSSNEKLAPGSTSDLAMPITVARSTTTTMSEVITNPSVKVASSPCARVCDRMPSVADGLRVTERAPQRRAAPSMAPGRRPRVNGSMGRQAKNTPVITTSTSMHCTSVDAARLLAFLRIVWKSSSAPPARAMSDSARVLTGASVLTVCSSTSFRK